MHALSESVIPQDLITAIQGGNEGAVSQLAQHIYTCVNSRIELVHESCKTTLLGIGGQSMTAKVEYTSPDSPKTVLTVAKVPSPLTLMGLNPTSMSIVQPYLGELLRREVVTSHQAYKKASEKGKFAISRMLFASNYLALEEYIDGERPTSNDSDLWNATQELEKVVNQILAEIRPDGQAPVESQTRIFMSSVQSLDIRQTNDSPYAAPERTIPKAVNFIKSEGGVVTCIDPFGILPLRIKRVVQQVPHMTPINAERFQDMMEQILKERVVTAAL